MRHRAPIGHSTQRQACCHRAAAIQHGSSLCSCSLRPSAAACPGPVTSVPHRTSLLAAAADITTSSDDASVAATCSTTGAADASEDNVATTSSGGSDASSNASSRPAGYQQHDILCCTCEGTPAQVYLQVVSPASPPSSSSSAAAAAGAMVCTRQGVTYRVVENVEDGSLTATPTGACSA
jgi:hypothetical protein